MRTTLDLPLPLIDKAMKCSHQSTKTATIIAALEGLVQKSKIQELKQFRGKVDLNLDLGMLRNRA